MAQRRMFSKQITDTDQFLDMPATAQNLYFHLNMHADDDGFLGNAKTIRRMVGASEDDLKVLVAKQFILLFPDGVAVIRDWHIHNYIQKDRYHQTVYVADKSKLKLDDSKRYRLSDTHNVKEMDTSCIQHVSELDTEVRLGKSKVRDRDIYSASSGVKHPPCSDKSEHIPYKEIISYLNKKTGSHYRSTGKATKTLIRARWHEGYQLKDFKQVIDNQAFSWQGTKFWRYMRPTTLFNASKFEGYLNANVPDSNRVPIDGGYEVLDQHANNSNSTNAHNAGPY